MGKIEIYIHGNDCVPSLSLGVFARLKKSMMEVDNLDLGLIISTIAVLEPDNPLSIQTLEAVQAAISSVDLTEVPLLKHPGQVYYFRNENGEMKLFKLNGDFFSDELMLQCFMVLHHMQYGYEKAFASLYKDQLLTEDSGKAFCTIL